MTQRTTEERAIVLDDWPQPSVVADPRLFANDSTFLLRYRADGAIVVLRFPLCNYFTFGAPNDEALNGHPLYNRGLKHYSVHEVIGSSLIAMLERRNSVHPRHDRESYLLNKKHYIFTFQDSTLECVVSEGEWWKPTVKVCVSEDEVERAWQCGDA